MTKSINVLSGNPGIGKTELFLQSIQNDKRYVYAAPTRDLAMEVMQRLDSIRRTYTPIFTSQTQGVGSVIHRANIALDEKSSPMLIITHRCLESVRPELLAGWELCMDESPKTEQIESRVMRASEYELIIAPFVDDVGENGELILNRSMLKTAYEIHEQGIDDAKYGRKRNTTLLMVLDAMLSSTKTVTAIFRPNDKGNAVVHVQVEGFVDFTRPFSYANSVTLMGANIDRSLVAKHAERNGFTIQVDKRLSRRKGIPTILPLIKDCEGAYISKRMLLTNSDGTLSKDWHPECFGQYVLDRALDYVGGRPAIFASHEWCKPDLPQNVERIKFDTRGLNKWIDKHVSIHMLHGNPSPDEYGPAKRIIQKMGIPLDEGRHAMRQEREDNHLVQFAHRTNVRKEDSDDATYHIVTSYTQARRLARDFDGNCIIDTSLMLDPPRHTPTGDQAKRDEARDSLAMQAMALQAEGLSQRDIASRLGTNQSKVKRLLRSQPMAV